MNRQRLIGIEISNFLRVSMLKLKLDSDRKLVIITGKNGHGKSSVLHAIEAALGGGNAIPAEPIKRGNDSGYTILETTDYIVKRTYSGDKTSIVVEAKEGGKINSPQKLLNSLVGSISFDPLAFSTMKSGNQLKSLQKLLNLDFEDLDKQREVLYQQRQDLNRDLTKATTRMEGIANHPDVPKDVVSMEDLLGKLEVAQKKHEDYRLAQQFVEATTIEIEKTKDSKKDAEVRISNAETELKLAKEEEKSLEEVVTMKLKALERLVEQRVQLSKDLPDLGDIRQEISDVEELNQKVRSNQRVGEMELEIKELTAESETMDTLLDEMKAKKAAVIGDARMPVEGLMLTDEGIRFNDLPLAQCSQAEKLRISTAIGMAENPKLALMLIEDGSLLDSDSMALMEKLAEEYDCQVLMEYTGEHKNATVILENGMEKAGVEETEKDKEATDM